MNIQVTISRPFTFFYTPYTSINLRKDNIKENLKTLKNKV